jgi:hypothetical protein
LSLSRLSRRSDGQVVYQVKASRRGKATERVMTPLAFMARISALVPPPRHPLLRFFGVFAPNASWRAAELGLKGKPDPDIFVVAAKQLGFEPHETLMVEDAISGITAGARGKFGFVLGIARHIAAAELLACGAHRVVDDLADISVDEVFAWFEQH